MSLDPNQTLADLLDRYLAGELTPDQRVAFEQHFQNDPRLVAAVERLRLPLGEVPRDAASPMSVDVDAAWLRQQNNVDGLRGSSVATPGTGNRSIGGWRNRQLLGTRSLRWRTSAVGAALVLGVIALVLRPARPAAVGITRTYVTRDGQQATVTMNDGTRFVMSPNTTLRLHDFAVQSRTVDLDGEAYINVAHASGLPFIVQGGNSKVQVLGTGFLIRHRAGSSYTRVAVTDGKVRLTTRNRGSVGVTIARHQVGELVDSTVLVSAVDELTPKTEWIRDQLVFRDTPLSAILVTIGRWYGYQFRYSDSTLAQRRLTIGVSTQSSMKALAEIERVLHVDLSVTGDTVTLMSQPPKRMNSTPRLKAYDVWIPTQEAGR